MFAQVAIAASFAIASYQDVKHRAVSDLVWIPAAAGVIYVIYNLLSASDSLGLQFELVKLGLAGIIILFLYYFGVVGEADLIVLFFFFADPYALGFFVAAILAAVVILAHLVYRIARKEAIGTTTIPIGQFLREPFWVPIAMIQNGLRVEVESDVNVAREQVEAKQQTGMMVEVKYGTPTAAYLGIGYILYVVGLVLFSYTAFATVP